jgi:flagellin-like protein
MFKGKKAVSPLVATLLLIVFAIALGTVVMNWGRAYIEEKAEFVEGHEVTGDCSGVGFSIVTIGGELQLCYDLQTKSLEFILENGPGADIENMQARVIGSTGIFTEDNILPQALKRTHTIKLSFTPGNIGDIKQFKLTPLIKMGADTLFCPDKSAVHEAIRPC